jgi:hypothetical protein
MRRLQTPTLRQWGCTHQWKTTHSLPQEDTLHRMRYHKCLQCGLRVKTEERLAVPWDQGTLLAMVAQAFPEGIIADVAALREQGLLGGGLSQLNAHLIPHGWYLERVRDRGRVVGVVRRRIPPEVSGGTITSRGKLKGGR